MLFNGCACQYIVDVYMYCSMVVYLDTCEVCRPTCAVQWLYISIQVRCVHVLFHGCTLQYM